MRVITRLRYGLTAIAIFACVFFSCKRTHIIGPENNELKATIKLSTGQELHIDGKANLVYLGCAPLQGTQVIGTGGAGNAAILIKVTGNNSMCVTAHGTYSGMNFECVYTPDIQSQSSPRFRNTGPIVEVSPLLTQVDIIGKDSSMLCVITNPIL